MVSVDIHVIFRGYLHRRTGTVHLGEGGGGAVAPANEQTPANVQTSRHYVATSKVQISILTANVQTRDFKKLKA